MLNTKLHFKNTGLLSLFCVIILLLCIAPFCFTAQESITITTYYPAPYGNYLRLNAYQMAIGSAYQNATLSDGRLAVSGSVRIGTTDPAITGKLIIEGSGVNTENTAMMRIQSTDSKAGIGLWNRIGGGLEPIEIYTDAPAPTRLYFRIGNNDRMVIGENGRVGIGTTNPQERLDINGNITVGDVLLRDVNRWASRRTITTGYNYCDGGANPNSSCATLTANAYPNEVFRTPGIFVSEDNCSGSQRVVMVTCSN